MSINNVKDISIEMCFGIPNCYKILEITLLTFYIVIVVLLFSYVNVSVFAMIHIYTVCRNMCMCHMYSVHVFMCTFRSTILFYSSMYMYVYSF